MEMNFYHKESMIASLNGEIDKLNVELQQVDGKLYNSTL